MLYFIFLLLWTLANANKCPENCWSWNDGCNTCTCDVFERVKQCTERHCLQQAEPFCEKPFKPAQDSILKIHVIGKTLLRVKRQEKDYTDLGAKCIDSNNIHYDIYVTGDIVNLRKTGTYTIEYLCAANGYKASAKRTIEVSEEVPCTKEYDPVCCESQTYSNKCVADSEACFKTNRGECLTSTESSFDCFDNNDKNDPKAEWCCKYHNLICPKPCIKKTCKNGFKLVDTDEKGCGGDCIRKSTGTDNVGIIIGIVFASILVIGIIVWISFITVRNKHREIVKNLNSKLVKKELKF